MREEVEDYCGTYDPTFVQNNINDNRVIEHFYTFYVKNKAQSNTIHRRENRKQVNKTKLYEEFYKIVPQDTINIVIVDGDLPMNEQDYDSDTYFSFSDLSDNKNNTNDKYGKPYIKIVEGIKFKINSKYMKRSVEIFRIRYDDFFSCVGRFHLNCVRGFYDGDDVKLLSTCVTALKTGICMNIKYLSGKRDPICIINKYRTRNFSVILNDFEKVHVAEYNGSVELDNEMYSLNIKDRNSVMNHFGPKNLTSDIYKPLKFTKGFQNSNYPPNANVQYILTTDDLYDEYKKEHNYDTNKAGVNFLAYKSINKDGNIEPLKLWVLEAAYDNFY